MLAKERRQHCTPLHVCSLIIVSSHFVTLIYYTEVSLIGLHTRALDFWLMVSREMT